MGMIRVIKCLNEVDPLENRSRLFAQFDHYIDHFYVYLTLYSVVETQLVLQLTLWVDSHDPELLLRVYASPFGVPTEAFFIVSAIFLLVSLTAVSSTKGLMGPILGSASIFGSMAIASVTLQGNGPLLAWLLPYLIIAAIYGFTASEDLYSRALERSRMQVLRLEYQEHRHLIGYLIQGATLMLATGGIGYAISSLFQTPTWCGSNTCGAWYTATSFILISIGWGVYGVFIMRYYLTMVSLKRYLTGRGSFSTNQQRR